MWPTMLLQSSKKVILPKVSLAGSNSNILSVAKPIDAFVSAVYVSLSGTTITTITTTCLVGRREPETGDSYIASLATQG